MGYYKKIDSVYVDGGNFSADGTTSELKKRGIVRENSRLIDNRVTEVKLLNYGNQSGAKEYGMYVNVECTFSTGDVVRTEVDGMAYLLWVSRHTVIGGTMEGDFLFLMQGDVEELAVRGGYNHLRFNERYDAQEAKVLATKELVVMVGDVVNIHKKCIYLGEYWYVKPNLRLDALMAKPTKYKLYINVDDEGNYLDKELYVESGKTKTNQPTQILGHIDFDMEELQRSAVERMRDIRKNEVGYRKGGAYNMLWASSKENNKAYVLTKISETKDTLITPTKEEVLSLGWLCGWGHNMKHLVRAVNSSNRTIEPYEYAIDETRRNLK